LRRESPASQMSDSGQKADSRPKPPIRNDTFPTTLEKIWGKLFDNGKPTERLGQFLRGIAMYLVSYDRKSELTILLNFLDRALSPRKHARCSS
jgi:hypothetical protein